MYLGRMMELAPVGDLFAQPLHPYTRELLAAIPVPDPDVQPARLTRDAPGRAAIAPRPAERLRLPHALSACAAPVRRSACRPGRRRGGGRRVACHRWRELPR